MNLLTSLFGGGLEDALAGILTHVTADQLPPLLRRQLHRHTSDQERKALAEHARAFAEALESTAPGHDDTAAGALAAVIGGIRLR